MSESTPSSLFHYTTAAGLLGIITDSALRATDLRFLNDPQEIVYAQTSIASALAAMSNPALTPGHSAHAEAKSFGVAFETYKRLVADELGSPEFPLYVACFCESGDLLSQWRAYGRDHGYAIEFDSDALQTGLAEMQANVNLTQVRYGTEEATGLVSAAVNAVEADENLGHIGVHAHFMARHLTGMLAGVKHPGFREEREWRVVVTADHEDSSQVQFRATSIAIVPYIAVPFPLSAIQSVCVGPGPNVDVRKSGVDRLLRALRSEAPVSSSRVPLRT